MVSGDYDTGSVSVTLKNVHRRAIYDQVVFSFVNQRVRTFNRRFTVVFQGRTKRIQGDLPAGPHGIYQVFITPEKYREKSVFVMVTTGEPASLDEVFFIDPAKAQASFPSYEALGRADAGPKFISVLKASGITADKYRDLQSLVKAGMLNLFAKMQATKLPEGSTVLDHVQSINELKPARFYARVSHDLHHLVVEAREAFYTVPGTLHAFPTGWRRAGALDSFKTHDRAGNLQLTFASNERGEYLVDADIDDHQGIEHAFDVVKHKVTGKDTHPYDIHQILVFFQGIDPGYSFI